MKMSKKSKKELLTTDRIIVRRNRSSHKGIYHDDVRGTIQPLWQGWHKIDNKTYFIKAWPNRSAHGTINLDLYIITIDLKNIILV
jgi:hypothetical protein